MKTTSVGPNYRVVCVKDFYSDEPYPDAVERGGYLFRNVVESSPHCHYRELLSDRGRWVRVEGDEYYNHFRAVSGGGL